jgi:hypothetical protein
VTGLESSTSEHTVPSLSLKPFKVPSHKGATQRSVKMGWTWKHKLLYLTYIQMFEKDSIGRNPPQQVFGGTRDWFQGLTHAKKCSSSESHLQPLTNNLMRQIHLWARWMPESHSLWEAEATLWAQSSFSVSVFSINTKLASWKHHATPPSLLCTDDAPWQCFSLSSFYSSSGKSQVIWRLFGPEAFSSRSFSSLPGLYFSVTVYTALLSPPLACKLLRDRPLASLSFSISTALAHSCHPVNVSVY